jgi:hypothetical protein
MKLSVVFLIGGITLLLPCASARQAPSANSQKTPAGELARYIGLRHGPSLPPGLKEVGGGLISETNDAEEYSVGEVHKGKVKMLWFERLTHRDASGKAYWEVKDVLARPMIRRGQLLVYTTCFSNNNLDREIIAIADYQPDEEFLTRIRRAWRASRKTGKFEELPVKGIKCENVDYGI